MTTLSLKLPDRIATRLKSEARARKSTPAKLAREVLEKGLPQCKLPPSTSVYDAIKEVIGSIRGLPRDLATNPKYMEDFGE
jgi:predicted transcriptional regulator